MANSNGGLQGETIPAMFFNAVASRGGGVALREKDLGIWKSQSWSELGQVAREAGLGLVALGLAPGECASIVANTVKEWLHADYGILGAGGVSNGIYPTDAPTQVAYLLEDSQSIVVFVENDEQLDKVLEVRDRLPKLRNIIVFDME